VKAGQYECVYNNMPPYGLGKAGELIDAIGKREYVHPDKAEMLCLHAMIVSARIMVDPRQRGAQYGPPVEWTATAGQRGGAG
jgi:hypothetical protein